jgi:hypothetical protein
LDRSASLIVVSFQLSASGSGPLFSRSLVPCFWSTGRELNPRIQVLQTRALATSPPVLFFPGELLAGTPKSKKPTAPFGGWVVGIQNSIRSLVRGTHPLSAATAAAAHTARECENQSHRFLNLKIYRKWRRTFGTHYPVKTI